MLRELTKADIIPLLTKSEKRNHFINQKIQESKGELKSPYPSPIDYWNTIFDGFAKSKPQGIPKLQTFPY